MGIFLTLALWVGSIIIGRILQPRYPRPSESPPEKFDGITAEEGRCIPVLWGTRQFKGANIGWFGDLSTQAIVQSGVTTGYKYYMGAQYIVAIGLLDDVVAVHFNEKPLGASVTTSNNQIVFGAAPPTYTTNGITPGNYSDGAALAQAVENAMRAAEPGNWKVVFGFMVVSDRNDELVYTIFTDNEPSTYAFQVSAKIAAGTYTGATLAVAIATALNNSRPVGVITRGGEFTCTYSAGGGLFTIKYSQTIQPGTRWFLHTKPGEGASYLKTALTLCGFRLNVDVYQDTVNGSTGVISQHEVRQNRFIFAYAGSGAILKVTDAAFTAASLLGLSTAADRTLLNHMAESDFTVITATRTDQGDYIQFDIDDSSFFGTEGGVQGRLDIYKGSLTQAAASYLTTQFGSTAPGFRGLIYAVQHRTGSPTGMYVGNTNYPKPISFTIRRCPNQLGLTLERHNISGGDANPACMLWELLTDTIWGLGVPESQLVKSTFVAAGETLAAEGLGLSMILDATTPAADVVQEILRHIDGVLYLDHLTGLIAMRLARADYVVSALPLVSPSNAISCTIKQRSWEETRNVVRLRYVDRDQNYTERVYSLQDDANIAARDGEMAVEDIPMPGISNEITAALVCSRVLKVLSSLPRQVTLVVNRERWALRPGQPFRLTWPAHGITDMPCRVSTIGLGSLKEGEIRIQAVQDVVGPPWTGFVAPTAPPDDPAELPELPIVAEEPGETVITGTGVPLEAGA